MSLNKRNYRRQEASFWGRAVDIGVERVRVEKFWSSARKQAEMTVNVTIDERLVIRLYGIPSGLPSRCLLDREYRRVLLMCLAGYERMAGFVVLAGYDGNIIDVAYLPWHDIDMYGYPDVEICGDTARFVDLEGRGFCISVFDHPKYDWRVIADFERFLCEWPKIMRKRYLVAREC